MNFAVAAKEIRYFLDNPDDGLAPCNQPKVVFEGRTRDNTAFMRMISLRCDNTADITIVVPDNPSEDIYALVDLQRRGKPDGIVFDVHRTGKWNLSFWDEKLDGTFRLKGLHPDGELMPKSFVPRCGARRPLPDLKCAA